MKGWARCHRASQQDENKPAVPKNISLQHLTELGRRAVTPRLAYQPALQPEKRRKRGARGGGGPKVRHPRSTSAQCLGPAGLERPKLPGFWPDSTCRAWRRSRSRAPRSVFVTRARSRRSLALLPAGAFPAPKSFPRVPPGPRGPRHSLPFPWVSPSLTHVLLHPRIPYPVPVDPARLLPPPPPVS